MKAVLSNRIYMSADYLLEQEISDTLTYAIPNRIATEPPLIIKNMGKIRDGLISIPSGRTDLIPEDYEIVDKRTDAPVEFPEFLPTLRPSQQKIYDEIEGSAIINARVSWGKTYAAIAIATKLGQKTLIVVHNTGLREQWIRDIKDTLGIKAGIIGSGKFNIDSPIVVGNTQSLYKKTDRISKEFGTLIMDEMHHVPSNTFSRIIDSSYARHKIGLSGTVKRKDGKHVTFQDYFGTTMFKPPKENSMEPVIHIIQSDIRFPDSNRVPWAIRINELTSQLDYKELISVLATTYASKGHKVLVVSDRTQFISSCVRLIGEDLAREVTGSTDSGERTNLVKLLEQTPIIFGTQSIFSEGISVNPLSCIILATPINNEPLLDQLIGRVLRVMEGKQQPVVVDIHLKGSLAKRQATNRIGFYLKEQYKIQTFKV